MNRLNVKRVLFLTDAVCFTVVVAIVGGLAYLATILLFAL